MTYDLFNQYLENPVSIPQVVTDLDFDATYDSFPASKISGGVTQTKDGKLEIDYDNGLIKINFSGGGFIKIGNVGVDKDGNQLFGYLLNDGDTNRIFEGYQQGGF